MVLGALTFKDEGILPGMEILGKSLGSYFDTRDKLRAEHRQSQTLSQIYQNADFSTPEGQLQFLNAFTKAGGKQADALGAIKQFGPSDAQRLLSTYMQPAGTHRQPPLQQDPPPQPTPFDQEDQTILGDALQKQQESSYGLDPSGTNYSSHPATRDLPFNNVPDPVIGSLMMSKDPTTQNFGKYITDTRNTAIDQYNKEREYADKKTKNHFDYISKVRTSIPFEEATFQELEQGLNDRTPGQSTADWAASMFGKLGTRLVSPEGQLIRSAVKNYLIEDLSSIPNFRPNQFIEKMFADALVDLGKSDESNKVLVEGMRLKKDIKAAMVDVHDRLVQQYEGINGRGFTPANFERIFQENLKPVVEDLMTRRAYNVQRLKEVNHVLPELANKKVGSGTPLTQEMMTYYADKYGGVEKGLKVARHLGYKILSKDEVERYSRAQEGQY